MFEHHGAARTDQQNVVLAGYLATIAGFVDAVGVVVLDRFTSHVTGTVVHATTTLALRPSLPLGSLAMLAMFLVGAILSSSLLESSTLARKSNAYGVTLAVEAALLLAAAFATKGSHPWQVAMLCCAMGMQNALVTRLSGAVVRTTHLTGVVTDIGIEAGRWLRYWRTKRKRGTERPPVARIRLLGSIVCAFVVGATAGAFAAATWQLGSLLVPAAFLMVGASFAFSTRR
jgi:uncharacterized membrane protein YoaK (UPF0700 family)